MSDLRKRLFKKSLKASRRPCEIFAKQKSCKDISQGKLLQIFAQIFAEYWFTAYYINIKWSSFRPAIRISHSLTQNSHRPIYQFLAPTRPQSHPAREYLLRKYFTNSLRYSTWQDQGNLSGLYTLTPNTHIHQYSHSPIYQFTNLPIYQFTNLLIYHLFHYYRNESINLIPFQLFRIKKMIDRAMALAGYIFFTMFQCVV